MTDPRADVPAEHAPEAQTSLSEELDTLMPKLRRLMRREAAKQGVRNIRLRHKNRIYKRQLRELQAALATKQQIINDLMARIRIMESVIREQRSEPRVVAQPVDVTDEMAMACAMAVADEMARSSGNAVSMDFAPEILRIYATGIRAALDMATDTDPRAVDRMITGGPIL